MKRLIPIFTGKENDSSFIDKATEECDKLILLHVVQREEVEDVPAGFAGSRIKKGEEVMEEISEDVSTYLEVEKNMEWGNPIQKIISTAKLKDIDEIWMKKSKIADKASTELKQENLKVRIVE